MFQEDRVPLIVLHRVAPQLGILRGRKGNTEVFAVLYLNKKILIHCLSQRWTKKTKTKKNKKQKNNTRFGKVDLLSGKPSHISFTTAEVRRAQPEGENQELIVRKESIYAR